MAGIATVGLLNVMLSIGPYSNQAVAADVPGVASPFKVALPKEMSEAALVCAFPRPASARLGVKVTVDPKVPPIGLRAFCATKR